MLMEIYKECPDWLKYTQRLEVIMHIQHPIINYYYYYEAGQCISCGQKGLE